MNQDTQLILQELARLRQDTNQHFEDMQNQMDSRFADFEAKMDTKLDSRFADFGIQVDEKLDSRFAASENLVLEEVDRTRSILESRIDKLDKDVQELKPYARISNIDYGNLSRIIQAVSDLQDCVKYFV